MTDHEGLLTGIHQLTMNWASPILVDEEANKDRRVVRLLHSSPRSWTSDSLNIQPDFQRFGDAGFQAGSDFSPKLVGLMVEGRFTSWFKGKPSPLLQQDNEKSGQEKTEKKRKQETEKEMVVNRVLEHSPESGRIFLFASNTFLTDISMELVSSVLHTAYNAPVQLMSNVVDWSLEDRGLLAIRGRGQFARTLMPLSRKSQMFWEYLNYALALIGLVCIWILRLAAKKRSMIRYRQILDTGREEV